MNGQHFKKRKNLFIFANKFYNIEIFYIQIVVIKRKHDAKFVRKVDA